MSIRNSHPLTAHLLQMVRPIPSHTNTMTSRPKLQFPNGKRRPGGYGNQYQDQDASTGTAKKPERPKTRSLGEPDIDDCREHTTPLDLQAALPNATKLRSHACDAGVFPFGRVAFVRGHRQDFDHCRILSPHPHPSLFHRTLKIAQDV